MMLRPAIAVHISTNRAKVVNMIIVYPRDYLAVNSFLPVASALIFDMLVKSKPRGNIPMARTMVFTCFLGDVTWGWEPKDDQYMLVWLQTLLDGKFKFHITKKNAKQREVTKVTQVADLRKVTFKDDEFLKLLV